MKTSSGLAVLAAAMLALSACAGSDRGTVTPDRGEVQGALPAPLVKRLVALARGAARSLGDSSVKTAQVYGPDSRYLLVKASSGDLVQKLAGERKGFYLIVLHGDFVCHSCAGPAAAKPPRGKIATDVWSPTAGGTDFGLSNRPVVTSHLRGPTIIALTSSTGGSPGARVSARTTSSSRLILGGRVRCTATVSRSVSAGSPLGLTFVLRNLSRRTVKVPLSNGGLWLVVRAPDGTTYDTRVPLRNEIGPISVPTPIPPGTTKTVPWIGKYLRVRWRGPLRVTPGCGTTALPPLTVAVKAQGPPPDEDTAVADVVAASGHLLDHCRPQRAGVAVQGRIYPPNGSPPPMLATCSVSLRREGQFLVAQALIASPPGLGYARVSQPYEDLSIHHASPYEAVAWQFVVTKNGATPVAAAEADATKPANRMAPMWSWTRSGAQSHPGSSRCGGSGGSWGGASPNVEFISVCPS